MRGQRGVLLSILLVFTFIGCDSGAAVKVEKPKPVAKVPGAVDADAPEEFTTLESGLKYRIRRKSDGVKPTEEQTMTVDYRGWLDDETIFDTTYGTGGNPGIMQLKQGIIPAWKEALPLLGEGGMIELEVPAKLGYGSHGSPPVIPPDATLHFLIELIKVTETPKPPETAPTPPVVETGGTPPGKVDEDAPEEFTTTASGLKYRIRRKSDGQKPTKANSVKVHYRGWLDNGQVFDSSYARKDPTTFGVTQVIKGWTEGLQLVGTGGMIELLIPSDLGYGPQGQPPKIPPNSTLHFLVELLEVK